MESVAVVARSAATKQSIHRAQPSEWIASLRSQGLKWFYFKAACSSAASNPRRHLDGALGGLLAAFQRFELRKLGLRFFLRGLGLFQLAGKLGDRAFEVVAPRHRRARIGRVGEMARVGDAGAFFFDGDFAVEINRH